ncbi:MAG: AAA family ATPase [Bacteriovoracaceae bacterium]|nr:AAA family ATPase [Bacteriovoracaceae bacterium]
MTHSNLILESIKLQNFATFKSHSVSFSSGLNAIIGETGSGKSLLLDALQLVFGGRADKKSVRHGCDSAIVEAVMKFNDAGIRKSLEEMGFPSEDDEIIIKRMIKRDGTSKCWLNQMVCSLGQLVTFSRRYIDLVGQFENQKLLNENYQLKLLDQYGETTQHVDQFRSSFSDYKKLIEDKENLEKSHFDREQRLDYLKYQIDEIESLNPSQDDEEKLNQIKSDFLNFEKKKVVSEQLLNLFEGHESHSGMADLLSIGRSLISKNLNILPAVFVDNFSNFESSFEELRSSFKFFNSSENDPEQLQMAIDKLDQYQKIKRKFGGSIDSVIETLTQFKSEEKKLSSLGLNLEDIILQINKLSSLLQKSAIEIHSKRMTNSIKFSKELTQTIRDLKMDGAEIKLQVEKSSELTENGITKLSFMAQTNPGEGFYKVKEIASGGELSRILLALRQVLATHDSISIFLFDEIDTGMGGETALHIGKSLKKVSLNSQVIAITHLPQIASFADKLIVVSKETNTHEGEDRTESKVREVSEIKHLKREVEAMVPLQ